MAFLRHLVSEVGDKIKAETFDKTMKGGDSAVAVGIKGDSCSLETRTLKCRIYNDVFFF